MGTKSEELWGSGCFAKAHPDEPIFVLRGQDILAPPAVREWIAMARMHGVPEEKLLEAEQLAQKMEVWRDRKLPD